MLVNLSQVDSLKKYVSKILGVYDDMEEYIQAYIKRLDSKKENAVNLKKELLNERISRLTIAQLQCKDLELAKRKILESPKTDGGQVYNSEILKKIKANSTGFEGRLFFRGQPNVDYPLTSGIFRDNNITNEFQYTQELVLLNADQFIGKSNIEKLILLQHYGAKTRLLDITEDPLIALYFACCENVDSKGCVYIFYINDRDIKYTNDDEIQRLANIPFRDITDNFYRNDEHQNGYETYILKAYQNNIRMKVQSGAFIINGYCKTADDVAWANDNLVMATIDISNKKRILTELNKLNVNEAKLFQDISNTSHYLHSRLKMN